MHLMFGSEEMMGKLGLFHFQPIIVLSHACNFVEINGQWRLTVGTYSVTGILIYSGG